MRIKLTENIGVAGKSKAAGDILIVGKDVSQEDARYIVSIQRAVYLNDKEKDPDETPDELEDLSQEELAELAKDMGIADFEKLNKKQLIKAINKAEADKKK